MTTTSRKPDGATKIALAIARELKRNWAHLYQASGQAGGSPEFPAWETQKLASHFDVCIRRAMKRNRIK